MQPLSLPGPGTLVPSAPRTEEPPCGDERNEADAAKRKPLYDQLNNFILDEQFVIVVVSNPSAVVTRANVQNVQWDLHGARKYAEMWLA